MISVLGALFRTIVAAVAAASLVPLSSGQVTDGTDSTETRSSTQARARPNIVVIMSDDMRADDLRFAPRLRKVVANHGLTFQNSFAPFPLCCPDRASFLSGLLPHNHGVYSHKRPYGYGAFDDSRTVATALREAGYSTGFIGKYLNGYGQHRSLVSGRPSYKYVPRGWSDWRAAIDNPRVHGIHGGVYNYFDTPYNVNGRVDNKYRGRYQPEVVADFAADMAREFARRRHRSGDPFFMYVNFVAPHNGGPFEPDDPSVTRHGAGHRSRFLTPARPDWVKHRFRNVTRASGIPRRGGPTERNMADKPGWMRRLPEIDRQERQAMATVTRQRAQSIFAMDREIAGLVRRLKSLGEWGRTIFVFTSDNGYFLGEHRMRPAKTLTYEPSLRVPLVMTGPGMRSGEDRFDPISTVDLTATILDAAGASPPQSADGRSLLSAASEGDQGWRFPVITEFYQSGHNHEPTQAIPDERTGVGIRTARYSYIRQRGFDQLYDLRRDPYQDRSVADDPAYADVRELMQQLVRETVECSGEECRPELPAGLLAGPAAERTLTTTWWRAIQRRYGR